MLYSSPMLALVLRQKMLRLSLRNRRVVSEAENKGQSASKQLCIT
jgi:hypothetical protein